MLLEKLFENTLVLSLPHRFDRRAFVSNELKKININWQFFDAVNGYEMPKETRGVLLPGEIGIKESHIQMLQKAIDNNWDSVFIFEDDVEFCPDVLDKLTQIENVPDNCELLYLGGHHRGPLSRVKGEIFRTGVTFTTHAMWLKNTIFAESIQRMKELPTQQLDNCYVTLQREILACTFAPNIAWQRNDYSDIQNKFIDYQWLK